jgi:nucleoside-diphosphate-sugar epimerase
MKHSQKVLVTGATGFIGSNLAKAFVDEGREVHIITRPSSNLMSLSAIKSRIQVHTHDGTFEGLLKIVKHAQPTTVFHLASEFVAQHQSTHVESLLYNNVVFPSQLVEAMTLCGVDQLVNTGTSWQYYDSSSYKPVNFYASTKQAFEDVFGYYVDAYGLRVVTLNLFDTYGSYDPRFKLIKLLLQTAIEQKELLMSPGEQLIDLVHIKDVIAAYRMADHLLSDLSTGHLKYGVSSGTPVPLKKLVLMCEKAWGLRLQVVWGARPYREREVMRPWDTYEKLPGWQPHVPLLDGLRQVFDANS